MAKYSALVDSIDKIAALYEAKQGFLLPSAQAVKIVYGGVTAAVEEDVRHFYTATAQAYRDTFGKNPIQKFTNRAERLMSDMRICRERAPCLL